MDTYNFIIDYKHTLYYDENHDTEYTSMQIIMQIMFLVFTTYIKWSTGSIKQEGPLSFEVLKSCYLWLKPQPFNNNAEHFR